MLILSPENIRSLILSTPRALACNMHVMLNTYNYVYILAFSSDNKVLHNHSVNGYLLGDSGEVWKKGLLSPTKYSFPTCILSCFRACFNAVKNIHTAGRILCAQVKKHLPLISTQYWL